MELRLTDKEQELLLELLSDHYKHLLHEINKAHYRDCKATLRDRCNAVEEMMERLKEPIPSSV